MNKSMAEASFYAQKRIGALIGRIPLLKEGLAKLTFLQGRGLVSGFVDRFNLAPEQDYAKWDSVIEEMYATGNRSLIEFFGLDLHPNYPLAGKKS